MQATSIIQRDAWAGRQAGGWNPVSELPRAMLAHNAILATAGQDQACYAVERGLLAVCMPVQGKPMTCVGLAGPGDIVATAPAFDLAEPAEYRAIGAAQAVAVPLPLLRDGFDRSPALRSECARQLLARIAQAQRIAACNVRHTLPERCACWLLRLHAYLGDDLPVTHEVLSNLLGVRRAGVTAAVHDLHACGAIAQHRGSIVVRDQQALRRAACSCALAIGPVAQRPLAAISALSERRVPPLNEMGPRARTDAAISRIPPGSSQPSEMIARFDAALDICRSIIAETAHLLEA